MKETRFYQEVFAGGLEEGREEGQREERLRIARSLLDVMADDRLLAEKTGLRGVFVQPLSEAEVRGLREKGH
ncbi:MAG: hypothetical protein WAV07_10680 [Candidatus Contendobacter sp.]